MSIRIFHKFCKKKLYLRALFIFLLVLIPEIQSASALVPEDILVIYNQNLSASFDVAKYYIYKRKVPAGNLLGLKFPDSECISRKEFEKHLPAIQKAINIIKKNNHNPVILLVYGIPIKIENYTIKRSSLQNELIEQKIKEHIYLITKLINQLNKLTGTSSNILDNAGIVTVLREAQKSLNAVNGFLIKNKQNRSSAESGDEIGSLILRLVGLSSFAKQQIKQAESGGEKLSAILENNNLLNLTLTLDKGIAQILFLGVTDQNAFELASFVRSSQGLIGELNFWYGLKEADPTDKSSAALDSELPLLFTEFYSKAKWLPNPFLKQFDNVPGINRIRETTIKVCRLDASSPELAKRIVDDAIWAENNGLKGIFYIDARGLSLEKKDDAYGQYDEHLRKLYELIKKKSSMPVVFDNKPELFTENSCPDAALYCGWYSLGKYIDSFKWQRGSVGFHIASAEATTLKKANSQVWCKRMIEKGTAATLGPTEEPYLNSFPLPDIFFPMLMSGKLPLLEVYFKTTPYISWRQILIGDPLYTPFKKHPAFEFSSQ